MTVIQFPEASTALIEILDRFAEAMRKRGLIPPRDIQADGKIHRCDVIGKRGRDDGSYLLFQTGKVPAGGFQNFKDGLGWENWRYDLGRQTLTAAEEYDLQKKLAIAERERAEKARLDAAAVERRAQSIWARAREAGDHPYLAKKKIKAYGTRIFKSALVVPANDADGKLRGLQFIDAHGKKLWMKGSRPTGAFCQIGSVGDTIAICEGFATGATIHATTGHAVIVAFSAGNLKAVAEAVRRKHPSARVIIGADDDHETKNNPGRYAGLSAALAIDAEITDPSWNTKLGPGLSDFNDLAVSSDPDFVRSAFQFVATPANFLERKLVANPFSAFDECAISAVVDIKARDRAAFEMIRDALKRAGARTTELDKLWGEIETDGASEVLGEANAKQADTLVQLASEAELFHAADLTAYATFSRDGHRETYAISSHGFKSWLRHRFYEEMKSSPGSETFRSALGTIEAKAIFSGEQHEVYLRVAEHDGAIYIDLGNKVWSAVEVTPDGWRIVGEPPVRFRRAATMLPLPLPALGGSIAELRPFINVPGDDAFILTVAFIPAAMRPVGPYPILSLHGAAGTTKSTFSEVIRRLVDPGKPMLRSLPREKEDFFIAAHNNHVLAFENISYIPTWISDLMCQLATGGGHSRREPYTAMDETVFDAQRPQVLNGIEDFVIRGDLANRAVPLVLQPIEENKRRHERGFWHDFEAKAPHIFGALLTALANGLKHLPTTTLEVLPRMADFAIWATACETGAPWIDGRTFKMAYETNRQEATSVVLEDDAVAHALQKFMATRSSWIGSATELLRHLTATWDDSVPQNWPTLGHKLSNRLRRIQPQLTAVGCEVKFHRKSDHSRDRMIELIQALRHLASDSVRQQEDKQNQRHDRSGVASDPYEVVSDLASEAAGQRPPLPASLDAQMPPRTPGRTLPSGEKSFEINAQDARTLSDAKMHSTLGGVCRKCASTSPGVEVHLVHGTHVELHEECVRFWERDPTSHQSLDRKNPQFSNPAEPAVLRDGTLETRTMKKFDDGLMPQGEN